MKTRKFLSVMGIFISLSLIWSISGYAGMGGGGGHHGGDYNDHHGSGDYRDRGYGDHHDDMDDDHGYRNDDRWGRSGPDNRPPYDHRNNDNREDRRGPQHGQGPGHDYDGKRPRR